MEIPNRFPRMDYKLGAVISNTVMWISGTTLGSAVDSAESMTDLTTEGDVFISLPIFITSLIATAAFTWTVARYDARQRRMAEESRDHLERMYERLDAIEGYLGESEK